MIDNDMLLDGINEALNYLRDIVDGDSFGDLDDTVMGQEGKHTGLVQIEMVRAALSVLRKNLKED